MPQDPPEPETEDSHGFQSNKPHRESLHYRTNVEEPKNVRQKRAMRTQKMQKDGDQEEEKQRDSDSLRQMVGSKRRANDHARTRVKYSIIGTVPEPKSEIQREPSLEKSSGDGMRGRKSSEQELLEKEEKQREEVKKFQEMQLENKKQIEELRKEQELMSKAKEKQEIEIDLLKKKSEEEKERYMKEIEELKKELNSTKTKQLQYDGIARVIVEPEVTSPTKKPPPAQKETQQRVIVPEVAPEEKKQPLISQSISSDNQSNSRIDRSQGEEYVFAKILSTADHQYKLTVYAKRYATQRVELRMCMRCLDDPLVKVRDEVLDDESLQKILAGTALKDVTPLPIFAKGLTTLPEIVKYGVLPFAQLGQDGEDRNIEIWVHAGGIIKNNGLQVSFLGSTCHMGLHHVEKEKMRISLTLIDFDRGGSLYINLNYDKSTFLRAFPTLSTEDCKEDPKEEWATYFETVTEDFLHEMDPALTEIEVYLRRTHRGRFSFENVAKDPTLRLIEVNITYPNKKQVLWIVREKPETSSFEIYCKGLFNVSCKHLL